MKFKKTVKKRSFRLRFETLESRRLLAFAAFSDSLPIDPTIRPTATPVAELFAPASGRIINGTPTSEFPSVGVVMVNGSACTGTLIAPRFALTAAHCTEGATNTQGRFTVGGRTYSTTRIIDHPNYDGSFGVFGTDLANDISIFELNAPVTNVTPSNLFRTTPTVGSVMTLVGFGGGGTGDSGSNGDFGTKRVGTTPIDSVSRTLIRWSFDNNSESNTAPGDSGGPSFLNVGGEFLVAGITSGGTLQSAGIGDQSYNTRVDAYQSFIDGIINPVPISSFMDYVTSGSTITESFNTLAASGTSSTLPAGWFISESGTNANAIYTAGTGSSNSGDTYSLGSDADRALGTLQSGSLTSTIGAAIRNSSAGALTSATIAYRGEQWRLGTAGRADRLDFQYSTNATSLTDGTWTDVDALDFSSPTTTGTVGARDGNAAANQSNRTATITGLNLAPGAIIWVRWLDVNATGPDDALAIDDFQFSSGTVAPTNTPPTITSLSNVTSIAGNVVGPLSFTVGDAQTPAAALTVTATSSSAALLAASGIALAGSGANRTITLTPIAGQVGSTTLNLTVSDGTLTTTTSFTLTVNPVATTDPVLRIVSYNISGASSFGVRAGMSTLLQAIGTEIVGGIARQVDLFALQEVASQATTSATIASQLNALYGSPIYVSGTLNGATSGAGTQGVVYNSQTLQLLGEQLVGVVDANAAPRQTIRHLFRPIGTTGEADFYVYNSHLKASDSNADERRRFLDVQAIRDDADALGQGAHILYVGDFNMFRSTDDGYVEFLSPGNGQAFDPVNRPGVWNKNPNFADLFTQAPSATASNTGLDGGGLNDRLDFQLISGELRDGVGLDYIPGSYRTFGNNGTVVVDGSINDPSSTALAGMPDRLNILNLLRSVSDHLPVVADFSFVLTPTNQSPTDIQLAGGSVAENSPVGSVVGTLSSTDPDAGNAFTYTLASGPGSTDNASFTIVGNQLRTAAALDFEASPTRQIRIRTTDAGGLFFEKAFVLTLTNVNDAVIANRQVFYNRALSNVFGNGSGNPTGSIDPAIVPLLPGQTATLANLTNYVRGLNGLIVDLAGSSVATTADFAFATWDGIATAGFQPTIATPQLTVLPGVGQSGSSRVKIEFADNAIANTWLRVTVRATANTDLPFDDVFYFANVIGEMGVNNLDSPLTTIRVNASDTAAVRQNQSLDFDSVDVSNRHDLDKDGRVNATDTARVRQNQRNDVVRFFTTPGTGRSLATAASVSPPAIALSSKDDVTVRDELYAQLSNLF